MSKDYKEIIKAYKKELTKVIDGLRTEDIEHLVHIFSTAREKGRTIFIIGNGGSAATASHFACDLNKTSIKDLEDAAEKRIKAMSLADNIPLMTAYGNDVGYEEIFTGQLKNVLNKDDILIAISGSGNSQNVINAVKYANENGAKTVGILGFMEGGKLGKMVSEKIVIQSNDYGIVEDLHLMLDHIITRCLKA